MKKLLFTSLIAIPLLLLGCASSTLETKVSSNLHSYEYNDLASNYMARPTFVTVESYKSQKVLHVTTNEYGKVGYNPHLVKHVFFSQSNVDEYISLIDKYFKWEGLTTERGDQLDKNIGKAKAINDLSFDFYSSNKNQHYLVISTIAPASLIGGTMWEFYFPKDEVKTLRQLLIDFKNGKFKKVDVNEIYQ